jgi:ammonium transporter, Amt family
LIRIVLGKWQLSKIIKLFIEKKKKIKILGLAIVGYWAIGWGLAYGPTENEHVGWFLGTSKFFLAEETNYPKFFFQYVFAATSATIVSGAVAERCHFFNYITYCTVISCK